MERSEKRAYEAIQQLMLLKHEKVMSYTYCRRCYFQALFCFLLICILGFLQARKKKIKEQQQKKAYEAEKAKTEQLTKKRQREERRERYREEDKQKKRARR